MHDKFTNYVRERGKYDKEIAQQNAKNRLRAFLKKKMTTLMVGLITEFEERMGHDWGHGKTNDDRTDEQLDKLAIWKICRNNSFDLGHIQMSAVERELDNYLVEMNNEKHQYIFKG